MLKVHLNFLAEVSERLKIHTTLIPFSHIFGDVELDTLDLGDEGMVKLVPLTQKICLGIYSKSKKITWKKLSKDDVRTVNKVSALHAHRYVIGRDRALLNRLMKEIIKNPEWKNKFTVPVRINKS